MSLVNKQILTVSGNEFLLGGKPWRILSGAMHYFRIPRAYWRDRLEKLRQCGFNTVETYVHWGMHEKTSGSFDFSGELDLGAYIDTATELGLKVILRPGPFICAETDLGGIPPWLLAEKDIALRCYNEKYLYYAGRYLRRLFGELKNRFCTNGGSVIAVQLENEYGSYGDDKEYLRALLDIYKECGVDCLIFTADGPQPSMLGGGTLPGIPAAVNFGTDPDKNFGMFRDIRPEGPLFCGEFWCGWFDHWHEQHHTRSAEDVAKTYRRMLELGASVNMYMFHGGTNFGFSNGANAHYQYQPTVTSYDYSAPLTEAGDITDTYLAIRAVLSEYTELPPLTAKNTEKTAYGDIEPEGYASLFSQLDAVGKKYRNATPLSPEKLGQSSGFTLYKTEMKGPYAPTPITVVEPRDRVQCFINGKQEGVFERGRDNSAFNVTVVAGIGESNDIMLLCENMGHVNFGPLLFDEKGIRSMRIGQRTHFGWDMYTLPMDDLSALSFSEEECAAPCFLRYTLNIEGSPKDTFLSLPDFTNGFVTVNGINIGRYRNYAGPQYKLFVPAPFLREGKNEIIVFETDKAGKTLRFSAE